MFPVTPGFFFVTMSKWRSFLILKSTISYEKGNWLFFSLSTFSHDSSLHIDIDYQSWLHRHCMPHQLLSHSVHGWCASLLQSYLHWMNWNEPADVLVMLSVGWSHSFDKAIDFYGCKGITKNNRYPSSRTPEKRITKPGKDQFWLLDILKHVLTLMGMGDGKRMHIAKAVGTSFLERNKICIGILDVVYKKIFVREIVTKSTWNFLLSHQYEVYV